MNTIWSDYIQSSVELYASRELRFREDNIAAWLPVLQASDGMRILEVGCAAGLLLHRIKTALPGVQAIGLDRDSAHIAFARQKTQELGLDCEFVEGDALCLPFAEDSFDLTLSHTVIEHVETQPFLREQRRVLRPGGRIVVLSVRTSLNVAPENWKPVAGEEKELFETLWSGVDMELDRQNDVGKYEMRECDFPKALEQAGFQQIDVSFISLLRYAPDNHSITPELAEKMISENRVSMLESTAKALRRNPDGLTPQQQSRLRELIDDRCDRRLQQYRRHEKLWDMATSTVMVVTGKKA